MQPHLFEERSAKILANKQDIVSRDMDVFYNPVMMHNRDLTVLLLQALNTPNLVISDPLAATGVRAIRLIKEVPNINHIFVNDIIKNFEEKISANLASSGVDKNKFTSSNTHANKMMWQTQMCDFIDIDPFGSPNAFLDAAVQRVRRHAVLAVTATDTAALCGTYPRACTRKYWAIPIRDESMHEWALRILIRKVQLVGVQHDVSLIPIFSYAKEHYVRIFLRANQSKNECDSIQKLHQEIKGAGPFWTGGLWDTELVQKMHAQLPNTLFAKDKELDAFLQVLEDESKIDAIGIYDIHQTSKRLQLKTLQRKQVVIDKLMSQGFAASQTHVCPTAIRTNAPQKIVFDVLTN